MYLTIALSPLVWLMNWLSYLNGSAHLSTKQSSFGGTETWEQIDFFTRFQPEASPAVMARGMLGMMRYDATQTLARISVPTLVVAGKPRFGHETGGQRAHPFWHSHATADHTGSC
jgi:hypothetical protein